MPKPQAATSWKNAAHAALFSGSAASVLSALTAAGCGVRDGGSAAGPLNGPSQWIWGRLEAHSKGASVRHTVVGYLIHHLASFGWAVVHERAFPRSGQHLRPGRAVAAAMTTTFIAYCVDYHLTPDRLRPGFRKHLTHSSRAAVYVAFAIGLAVARLAAAAPQASRPRKVQGRSR